MHRHRLLAWYPIVIRNSEVPLTEQEAARATREVIMDCFILWERMCIIRKVLRESDVVDINESGNKRVDADNSKKE
jgi:hypothetical protein